MKLTEEQVEEIIKKVIANLLEKKLIVYKAEEKVVHNRMVEAFIADLKAEDRLDDEVKELLDSHSGDDEVDYRKMFNMVKGRLIRERDLII